MTQPGIQQHTCYTATCGSCDEGFGDGDYTLSYATEEDLLAALRREGWDVLHDRLRCRDCRNAERCGQVGHDWSAWWSFCQCTDHGEFHSAPHGCPVIRDCERCGHLERRDPEWSAADDADVARLLGGDSR